MAGPPKCFRAFGGAELKISMYYTYVLLCKSDKLDEDLYIGFTSDLRERVKKHQAKNVKTTSKFEEVVLVYYEACLSKEDAQRRELQLKTGFGRGFLKRRIENYFAGMV